MEGRKPTASGPMGTESFIKLMVPIRHAADDSFINPPKVVAYILLFFDYLTTAKKPNGVELNYGDNE